MVGAVDSIKNNQASSQGTNSNASSSFMNGAASIFRGISNVAEHVGDNLIRAGRYLSGASFPVFYYGCGPWGWADSGVGIYGYPMYFGPLTGISIPDSAVGGVSCGYASGYNGAAGFGGATGGSSGVGIYDSAVSPIMTANAAMDVSGLNINYNGVPQAQVPIYNPGSVSEAFLSIDRAVNPQNYNYDGTPKASANNKSGLDTTEAKNKPIELTDAQGKIVTPNWYKQIANKIDQNKELTSEEKELYQRYNSIRRKYSPYLLDENLDIKVGADGQPMESPFFSEIEQLQHFINRKNRNQIEAYINSCSPEKLAALELYYPTVLQKVNGGKSLREALKDACLWSWCEWTNVNTDRCKRMFDKLDEAAMMTPTNMHNALDQALNRHRMWGFGFDEQRLCKLLRMMEENKLFRKYVKDEYRGFIGEADDKWFKDAETENLLNRMFK